MLYIAGIYKYDVYKYDRCSLFTVDYSCQDYLSTFISPTEGYGKHACV